MIKFYFSPAPNPAKVALFLEEAGLPYELIPIDTRRGDQFKPEFLALNPNAKVPVIVDGDVRVFDSTPSCCTWLRKLANSCLTIRPKRAANCSRG
jgi:glutathione S-transferase